jgi:hypothetical protein
MTYERLTPDGFARRLKAQAYKGAVGARRAVGKSDWTNPQREKAHALIDRHYPNAPPRLVAAPPRPPKPKRQAKRKPPRKTPARSVEASFYGQSARGGPLLTCDRCAAVYRVNAPCSVRLMRAVMHAFEEDHSACKGKGPPSVRFTVEERGGDE